MSDDEMVAMRYSGGFAEVAVRVGRSNYVVPRGAEIMVPSAHAVILEAADGWARVKVAPTARKKVSDDGRIGS